VPDRVKGRADMNMPRVQVKRTMMVPSFMVKGVFFGGVKRYLSNNPMNREMTAVSAK